MGAESIRELLKDLDLAAEAARCARRSYLEGPEAAKRAIKRLKVVSAFRSPPRTSRSG